MPRRCSICTHPEQAKIDSALLAGEPFRHIAKRYGTSTGALLRHKADHLPEALVQAHEVRQVAEADRLLEELRSLQADAKRIAQKAERADSYSAAVSAIREQSRIIELLLKVAGELSEASVSIHVDQAWIDLRAVILDVLDPYPEARLALAEALDAR